MRGRRREDSVGRGKSLLFIVLAVCISIPTEAMAQLTQTEIVGFVRNDGFAFVHFRWEGSSWRLPGPEPMDATPISFVDQKGDREHGVLEAVEDAAVYRVPELEDRVDPSGWYRQPIGYFVTPGMTQVPFLEIESPLTDAEWLEILADVQPPPTDTVPDRLSVKVWKATLGAESVTYFAIDRQGDLSPGCPPLFRFTGWFPARDKGPVFTGVEVGDCDGKGSWRRQPYALLSQGGELFLFIGKLGWGDDASDLWRVEEGELRPAAIASYR